MTITLNLESLKTEPPIRRSLTDLSLAVARSKKIVVVTGAGISCSCGIPDFRSSDGLYNLVKQKYPDVVLKGRDLFDASLFRDPTSTAVFYTFISQLKQSIDSATPSPTHQFIKTLDTKQKLLRSYTQNIDGLEERAGLLGTANYESGTIVKGKPKLRSKDVRNVQLHGDIHRVRCTFCSADFPCEPEHLKMFNDGVPPDCPECTIRSKAREARSARSLKIGTLRPAIVLYDEPHPLGDEIGTIQTADMSRKPDMLIIMGTSLKVHGLKKLVKEFARIIHGPPLSSPPSQTAAGKLKGKVIFVNKTAPAGEWADVIDYHVEGETDRWVERVLDDWKRLKPADWEVQKKLVTDEGDVSISGFKVVKSVFPLGTKGKAPKKKPAPGSENIPPTAIAKTKDSLTGKSLPASPPSPGKRGRDSCHYSDVHSSPSKKRSASSDSVKLTNDERKLLFGLKRDAKTMEFSLGKENTVEVSEGKTAVKNCKPTRTRSQVWVQVPPMK